MFKQSIRLRSVNMEAGGKVAPGAIIIKPGVGSSYGNGWRQLWKNFGMLLVAGIIVFALTVVVGAIIGIIYMFVSIDSIDNFSGITPWTNEGTYPWIVLIVNGIINVLYFTPIFLGLFFTYMTAARGDKVKIENVFAAFRNYGNVILAGIVFTLIGLVSSIISLINIPFLGIILNIIWFIFSIFLYCKLAFVPYLLLDRKMKAGESIETSWRMTNGHAWKVFLIGLLGIPIVIAGFICLIIGSIISVMWIYVAIGSLYHAVSSLEEEAPAVQPSPIIP